MSEVSGWPVGRGLLIGFVAGVVLTGAPLVGLAVVAGEVWWVWSLHRRGPQWQGFAKRVAVGAGVGFVAALGAWALLLGAVVTSSDTPPDVSSVGTQLG